MRRRDWKRCLTTDGPGRTAVQQHHATSWCVVGRRGMVQWAEDQRDSRCSAHPLLRRAAGAPLNLPGRPPARARCRTHLVQEGRTPRERSTCRRSSADREHLATNEGVGSSNLSDGVTVGVLEEFLGGSVSGLVALVESEAERKQQQRKSRSSAVRARETSSPSTRPIHRADGTRVIQSPGREFESRRLFQSRFRRAWARPRATGSRSSAAFDRARRCRTNPNARRGPERVGGRRRDAGANPVGPGSIWQSST